MTNKTINCMISAAFLACAVILLSHPQPAPAQAPLSIGTQLADLRADAKQADPALAKIYDAILQASSQKEDFEEKALEQIDALLPNEDIPTLQKLAAAQKILVAVLNWHKSERVSAAATAPPSEMETRLANELLRVRQAYLKELVAQAEQKGDWQQALAFADDLQRVYSASQAVRIRAGLAYLSRAQAFMADKQYRRVHEALPKVRQALPLHPQARQLEKNLEEQARHLQKQAETLSDKKQALARLEEALAIYPTLPGLRDELLKRRGEYQVLWVAVPQLPEKLSPATARTEVEKLAVELLFERLVQSRYDASIGQRYEARLAGLPQRLPQVRRFELPADARWPGGEPITSLDIRHTADLLLGSPIAERAIWTESVKPPRQAGRLLQVDFELRQPTLDPLAFFTFHILPRHSQGKPLLSATDAEFARSPMGSGPYVYQGRRKEEGRHFVLFSANPYYARADRPLQQFIREIRFFVPDMKTSEVWQTSEVLHLRLGATAEQMAYLKKTTPLRFSTLKNRRLNFLAVNHRRSILRNHDLRRGMAAAIDRDTILDLCFRGKDSAYKELSAAGAAVASAAAFVEESDVQAHQTANGLFPADSWAQAPAVRVPERLFDMEKARLYFGRMANEQKKIHLTLKYPQEDPRLGPACRQIAAQIEKAAAEAKLNLTIQPVPLPARDFYRDIDQRDYDLAYYQHDHNSEFYWLWPVFDPQPEALAKGGSNFLGYENDGPLLKLLRDRLSSPDFQTVRQLTHDLHSHLHDQMPLIPLWQLDVHIGVHPAVQMVDVEGGGIFQRVSRWTMKK